MVTLIHCLTTSIAFVFSQFANSLSEKEGICVSVGLLLATTINMICSKILSRYASLKSYLEMKKRNEMFKKCIFYFIPLFFFVCLRCGKVIDRKKSLRFLEW